MKKIRTLSLVFSLFLLLTAWFTVAAVSGEMEKLGDDLQSTMETFMMSE